MHPPSWICSALYRINPTLRLAWHGREKTQAEVEGGASNVGAFCLIQLFPDYIVGPKSDPLVYSELWEVSPRVTSPGVVEMVKVERGPIFNRKGGCNRDWDPLFFTPIFIIDLEAFGFTKERVLNGEFLTFLPRWMTSAKKRLKDSLDEKKRDTKRKIEAIAHDASEFLWHQAMKPNASSPTVAWKHAKADWEAFEKRKQSRKIDQLFNI